MAKENTASTTDQVSPVKDVEQKNPATPVPEVSEVKPEPPANEGPVALFEMAEGPLRSRQKGNSFTGECRDPV